MPQYTNRVLTGPFTDRQAQEAYEGAGRLKELAMREPSLTEELAKMPEAARQLLEQIIVPPYRLQELYVFNNGAYNAFAVHQVTGTGSVLMLRLVEEPE